MASASRGALDVVVGHVGRLGLGDERINDAAVLAVYPGNAAHLFQPQQGVIHIPLRDHHGRIGHVHFKSRNTFCHHFTDFPGNARIPVVDGHMEAVVASSLARRLFPPEVQTMAEGLPFVRCGEIHHHGGAAPEGCPAAGGKIVGSDGACNRKIEMGVAVDKTGEQELAPTVNNFSSV